MGYTPLFDTLTTGTLSGKWPDIGLWPILLSMANKYGEIDVTPNYIAGITGLPLIEVIDCIERLCAPDPYSRSKSMEGRRLVNIDPDRPWGWRIVNFEKYRNRARKAAYDIERTASGADAARKRRERESAKEGNVPTCPDESRRIPPSDADTNTYANSGSPSPPSHNGSSSSLRSTGTTDDLHRLVGKTADRMKLKS